MAEELDEILAKQGEMKIGEVVRTTGDNLECKHLLHVLTPLYEKYPNFEEANSVLRQSLVNVLDHANGLGDV